MTLDPRTVMVMGAGFLAVTALMLVMLVRALPADVHRSARAGALATAMLALAWALYSYEDHLPRLASVLGANLLYLLAVTVIHQSIRLLDGLPPRQSLYATLVLPTMLATLGALYLVDDYAARVVFMSIGIAVGFGLAAYRLFRRAPKGFDTPGRRLAGWWLTTASALLLVRAVATAIQGYAPPLLEVGPLQTVGLALSMFVALGSMFAYLLLVTGRVTAELALQAHIDPLTDLLNRRAFETRSWQELERAARSRSPVSLLMLDVDDFKHINDTYGHEAGDDTLRAMAEALRGHLRPYDLVARLGGDEFAVLLPGMCDAASADLAPRLAAAIEARPAPKLPPLSVSVGRSSTESGHADLKTLLAAADKDLYRQKSTQHGGQAA